MAKRDDKREDKKSAVPEKVEPRSGLTPRMEMERMFDDFFSHNWLRRWGLPEMEWPAMSGPGGLRVPHVDIINRDEEILLKAEIPGVTKEQVEVTLTDNSVTIKGETRTEEKEEKGHLYRSEIRRGSFSRTLTLPAEVDGDKAVATFKDGVLELTLPKIKKSNRRTLKIEP